MARVYNVLTRFNAKDGVSKVTRSMTNGVNRFGSAMKDKNSAINKGLAKTNKNINRFAIAGLASTMALATVATTKFIAYEQQLAKVGTIADTTTISLESQGKAMLDLSNQTGQAVTGLLEAQYQAISAGVATADSAGFVAQSTKTAIAGFADTATAVDTLTTVLNAYDLQASESTRISDQLLATQNFGKTTFNDMAQSLGNVIPIASQLNLKTEELFGSIAQLTKNGIQTPQAMTGIKAALSNILKPTDKATKLSKKLGLEFNAMALQSKGLSGFLQSITEKTGGSKEKMAQLFGSVEALNTVMSLTAKNGEGLSQAIEAVANSAGSTESAYEKMTNTLGFKTKLLKNKFDNTLLKLGDAMSPVIDAILVEFDKINLDEFSEKANNFFKDFDPKPFIDVGKALLGIGKFITDHWKTIVASVVTIKSVVAAMGLLNVITAVFGVTLAATPIGWIIGIVALLSAGIALLVMNWDAVTKAVKDFVTEFDSAIKVIIGIIAFFNPVVRIITLVTLLIKNWDYLTATIVDFGVAMKDSVLTVLDTVIGKLQDVWNYMSKMPLIGSLFGDAKDIAGNLRQNIQSNISTDLDGIKTSNPSFANSENNGTYNVGGAIDVNFNNAPEGTQAKVSDADANLIFNPTFSF